MIKKLSKSKKTKPTKQKQEEEVKTPICASPINPFFSSIKLRMYGQFLFKYFFPLSLVFPFPSYAIKLWPLFKFCFWLKKLIRGLYPTTALQPPSLHHQINPTDLESMNNPTHSVPTFPYYLKT